MKNLASTYHVYTYENNLINEDSSFDFYTKKIQELISRNLGNSFEDPNIKIEESRLDSLIENFEAREQLVYKMYGVNNYSQFRNIITTVLTENQFLLDDISKIAVGVNPNSDVMQKLRRIHNESFSGSEDLSKEEILEIFESQIFIELEQILAKQFKSRYDFKKGENILTGGGSSHAKALRVNVGAGASNPWKYLSTILNKTLEEVQDPSLVKIKVNNTIVDGNVEAVKQYMQSNPDLLNLKNFYIVIQTPEKQVDLNSNLQEITELVNDYYAREFMRIYRNKFLDKMRGFKEGDSIASGGSGTQIIFKEAFFKILTDIGAETEKEVNNLYSTGMSPEQAKKLFERNGGLPIYRSIFPEKGAPITILDKVFSQVGSVRAIIKETIRKITQDTINKKMAEKSKSKENVNVSTFIQGPPKNPEQRKYWVQQLFGFSDMTMNLLYNSSTGVNLFAEGYFEKKGAQNYIGDIAELLYGILLNKIKPGSASYVGGKTVQDLQGKYSFKNNKQGATDLFLALEESQGYVGFQVKNAFSESVATSKSHSITFINEKIIDDIFDQDLQEIPETDKPEIKQATSWLLANLVYGTNRQAGGSVEALRFLEQLYSTFTDLILDLGANYEEIIAGKDKNLFYIYMSQFIIPASSILKEVKRLLQLQKTELNALEKRMPVHIQYGHTDKNLIVEGINYERNVQNVTSFLNKNVRMSIDYSFAKDFIDNFDILNQAIQHIQK